MKKLVQCESIPAFVTEESAREIDALVKTLPHDYEYFRKALPVEIQFEPGERAEVSIISTDAVDRQGEVIIPEGISLDQYRRNGVVLWNHSHDKGPIARCTWIKLQKSQLRAKTNYDIPDNVPEGNWRSWVEDIWAMTVAGVLKAKSVGLIATSPKRQATVEELAEHPEWEGCVIRDSSILIEYSCCPTGVNQEALIEAINTKSMNPDRLNALGIDLPALPPETPKIQVATRMPTKEELIATLLPYLPKAIKKKKPVDINAIVEKALSQIDVNNVLKRAEELHKNRGRV